MDEPQDPQPFKLQSYCYQQYSITGHPNKFGNMVDGKKVQLHTHLQIFATWSEMDIIYFSQKDDEPESLCIWREELICSKCKFYYVRLYIKPDDTSKFYFYVTDNNVLRLKNRLDPHEGIFEFDAS